MLTVSLFLDKIGQLGAKKAVFYVNKPATLYLVVKADVKNNRQAQAMVQQVVFLCLKIILLETMSSLKFTEHHVFMP